MYNIHSHYENILSYVKTIIAQPTLAYLHPFGSTSTKNIELLDIGGFGPLLFCFDQEPILPYYNRDLFNHVRLYKDDIGYLKQVIVLNTEKNSPTKNLFFEELGMIDCYYFFHAFAAADWYRGYKYDHTILPIKERKLKKKYVTFNRITGGARIYRTLFLSELYQNDLLSQGHISFSDTCPVHGSYKNFLNVKNYTYPLRLDFMQEKINILDKINFPLRIDNSDSSHIMNDSQTINAKQYCIESFVHVVTETCYFEDKMHLTEKIFKPIVCKQPFLLLGCAHNLQYLKSYGFKSFENFWDESYDTLVDPLDRLNAVVNILNKICDMSYSQLQNLLLDMTDILEYNYNWFYSREFLDLCWSELTTNLNSAVDQFERKIYFRNYTQPLTVFTH